MEVALSIDDMPVGPLDLTDPRYSPRRLIDLFDSEISDSDEDIPVPSTDVDPYPRYFLMDKDVDPHIVCTINDKGKPTVNIDGMMLYLQNSRIVYDGVIPYAFNQAIYQRITDDDVRTLIYSALSACDLFLSRSKVADIIEMYRTTHRVEDLLTRYGINDDRYDARDNLIPFSNGIYNVTKDLLLPFTPFIFMPYMMQGVYNPKITDLPDVEEIYRKIIPDDGTRAFFFEMVGYTMFSPTLAPPAIFLIYGPGNTGKTALQEAVLKAIGPDNVARMSLNQLSETFSTANLSGKVMNISGETGSGMAGGITKADGELLKRLSDGQTIQVQRKYGQPFDMRNSAKLWFISNTLPDFGDTSSGLHRRLYIIPCRNEQKWEDQIYDRMQTEEAISWLINQALRAYLRFLHNGSKFTMSEEMKNELACYRSQEPVTDFLIDLYGVDKVKDIRKSLDGVVIRDLYQMYTDFVSETGGKPLSQRKFSERIRNEYRMTTDRVRGIQENGRPTNVTTFVIPKAMK